MGERKTSRRQADISVEKNEVNVSLVHCKGTNVLKEIIFLRLIFSKLQSKEDIPLVPPWGTTEYQKIILVPHMVEELQTQK